MAMPIIMVEMAVQNLFFFVCKTQRTKIEQHIQLTLMSCHANIISVMLYDKKKTKPKSNTLFPSQIEV